MFSAVPCVRVSRRRIYPFSVFTMRLPRWRDGHISLVTAMGKNS